MIAAITVSDLSFAYGGHIVLEHVDIEIFPGLLTMCLGRNGAGKSTFMRLIGGMLPSKLGAVKLGKTQIADLSFRERARKVSYLSQMHQPVFPFTVTDVVLTGRAGHVSFIPKKRDRDIALEMIGKVGISHLQDRYYTELSGGEQQMVMIARSLAQEPEILLLDEPTSHLDFNNQVNILSLLKKLVADGLTVVAVLHDPNMSLLFGDDFLFVHEGDVVRDHDNDPWDSPILKKIYPGNVTSIPYKGRALVVPDVD